MSEITNVTDRERILRRECDRLTAERDALAESDKRLREEVGNLQRGLEHYREQWSEVCNENQSLLNEMAALAAQEPVGYVRHYAIKHLKAPGQTVINHSPLADDDVLLYTSAGAKRTPPHPMCKGKNCGCTDGISHSKECLAEHEDATNPMVDGKRMYAAAGAAPVPGNWKDAVSLAYGHLWHVNNEPMAPIPLRSDGEASYAARKLLRDLLTTDERGQAINAVRELLAAASKGATS